MKHIDREYFLAICDKGLDQPAPYLVSAIMFMFATLIVEMLTLLGRIL